MTHLRRICYCKTLPYQEAFEVVGVESHTKSTLAPYKGQILELAMRGGVFHVKAKADVALHQAATKDAVAFRYAATKVNAKLCHAK